MPSKKPADAPEPRHALHYLGDATGVPHLSGIPSRDLSAADVRRLASNRGQSVAALVAEAVSSGAFTEAAPAIPAADSSADDSGKE